MDSAPMTTYEGKMKKANKGFAAMAKAAAGRSQAKRKVAAFKKSYQAPAVSGSSFTGAGSAGNGVGG